MPNNRFQVQFLHQLAERFEERGLMIQALSQTLSLSKDATYRRLRGDTVLSADELMALAEKYQLSLSLDPTGIPFKYNQFEHAIRSPEDYFKQLEQYLHLVELLPDKTLYYATGDLPFFYEMLSPRLMSFKLYIYGITAWNFEAWKQQPFHPSLIDNRVLEMADRIGRTAYRIPGQELWTMSLLDTTLNQVEYMLLTGKFADNQDAVLILDEIKSTVHHLEKMASLGKKFAPGSDPSNSEVPFALSHNELINTNSIILIYSPVQSLLFITFVTPNYIHTKDDQLCARLQSWFADLVTVSNPLDASSGKYRSWYFNHLHEQVKRTRQRVEQHITDISS